MFNQLDPEQEIQFQDKSLCCTSGFVASAFEEKTKITFTQTCLGLELKIREIFRISLDDLIFFFFCLNSEADGFLQSKQTAVTDPLI